MLYIIGQTKYWLNEKGDDIHLYINDELIHIFKRPIYPASLTIVDEHTLYCWFCTRLAKIQNKRVVMEYDEENEMRAIFIVNDEMAILVTELSIMWRSLADWSKLYEYDHYDVILEYKIIAFNKVYIKDFDGVEYLVNLNGHVKKLDAKFM